VKPPALPNPWLPPRSAFAGFRFPAEVIVVAVRWYLRYSLSYRDVEELLVERGVQVDHVTIYRGATLHAAAGRRRPILPPLAG
jgi:transposase-like protein